MAFQEKILPSLDRIGSKNFRAIANYLKEEHLKTLKLVSLDVYELANSSLIERDILSRTYNYLAKACYINDLELASLCLKLGANPNAVFCDSPTISEHCSESDRRKWRSGLRHFIKNPDEVHDFRVYPTIKLGGRMPNYIDSSALTLAVKNDSLDVMQFLLKAGANQAQHYKTSPHWESGVTPWQFDIPLLDWPHQIAMSHVESRAAAEMLLRFGGAIFLREVLDSRWTVLEMLLARFKRTSPYQGRYSFGTLEYELFIQLLLNHGAFQSRETSLVASAPVLAAARVPSRNVFKAVLLQGLHSCRDGDNNALRRELTLLPMTKLQDDTVAEICEDTIPTYIVQHRIPTNDAFLAIGSRVVPSIFVLKSSIGRLVALGANINLEFPGFITPLAQAVGSGLFRRSEGWLPSFIEEMFKNQANIDQSSICRNGFTPPFFASSTAIHEDIFVQLLQRNPNIEGLRQLVPNSQNLSIVQCLMGGFPTLDQDQQGSIPVHTRAFLNRLSTTKHRSLEAPAVDAAFDPDLSEMAEGVFENVEDTFGTRLACMLRDAPPGLEEEFDFIVQRQAIKLQKLLEIFDGKVSFYTEDGQHVLHWALEKLGSLQMKMALNIMLPWYSETKRQSDVDNPLFCLFSPRKCSTYFVFSDFQKTHDIVSVLSENTSIACGTLDGENILHRICQLDVQSIPDWNKWDETSAEYNMQLDICPDLDVRFPALYLQARAQGLGKIVGTLIKNGVDFYARDKTGKTPHRYAREHGLLPYIPNFV